MRLKADENLPQSVVKLLRDAGHDVHTMVDENLSGSTDAILLSAATRENRALITLDKDSADIRAYPPSDYSGIVVLRARDSTIARLRALTTRVIPLLSTGDLAGRLWIVDDRRIRVR
jgi:predicted nuclease of predicted toxin-antitoxin system